MAGRQVTYTTRSLGEIVNRLDPKRLMEHKIIYIPDNGKAIEAMEAEIAELKASK